MKKLISALILGLLLTFVVCVIVSQAEPVAPPSTLHSSHHFLPPYPSPRDRFGFDVSGSMSGYDVAQLHAGWYSNWGASTAPPHPDGLTYVQLIRFHAGDDPHDPSQVSVSPNRATIAQIAAAHPGSLWMMSNEPDSEYQGDPIYPEVYAHAYHEFYHYIKSLDPTALIANGGIVQPTPCRMEYLDIVLDTYEQAYGEPMPVDVWNIHAFTLREVYNSWGASTPPGVDPSCGIDYEIRDADDINIFRDNLIAFRQWMKNNGEQDKPLIISEYGILWPDWLSDEDGRSFPPSRVSHFMTQTFDLFLNESYPAVGYPEDDYRLVQTWAWYSLAEDEQYNGYLFHSNSKEISPMGETYAAYTADLPDTQYPDLAVQLWTNLEPLRSMPYSAPSITLPVTGSVANLGKLSATDVVITSPLLGFQATQDIPSRYQGDVGTLPLPSLVLTEPGVYDLSLLADPTDTIGDPRRWNNTFTETVDARPDLSPTMTWSLKSSEIMSGVLNITLTVSNRGTWPSPPVSATLRLSDAQGSLLLSTYEVPISPLNSGGRTTVAQQMALSELEGALYHLTLEVDRANIVDESGEHNNRAEAEIDAYPDLLPLPQGNGYAIDSSHALFHIPIANDGDWSSPSLSGTFYLSNTDGSLLLPGRSFSIPEISAGDQVTVVKSVGPIHPNDDIFRMEVEVDSDNMVDEQNEDNNRAQLTIPIIVTTTLQPDVTSVLTSFSGRLAFEFPAGTVITPTEIRFTPRLTSELPPGPPLGVTAFSLDAYRAGQPITLTPPLPITVTWNYSGTQAATLDEDALGLYYLDESGHWEQTPCSSEIHRPGANQLTTCILRLGNFTLGQGYDVYLPLVQSSSEAPVSVSEAESPSSGNVLPDSPLRLPPWATPTER